ncbi:MAG: alpha/beta hydrolase [Deltaproteobacteria bacterium]|nr:alpha/beta hydrolase [Deltaproteobacteria bacterium]
MILVITIIFYIIAVLAVLVSMALFWGVVFRAESSPDEIHFVITRDGWRIALHRYLPMGDERWREPVFLCHGLGANRFDLDLDARFSLARCLRSSGFDCWVIELRGAGMSAKPRLFDHRYRFDWTFEEYYRKDIPAAIQHIRQVTGADAVHWVGHSMGGMLLYAFLEREEARWIRSGVTIASPVDFDDMIIGIKGLVRLRKVLKWFPFVPLGIWVKLLSPLPGLFAPLLKFGFNPRNVDSDVARRVCANMMEPLVCRELLLQFGDWLDNGRWRSLDRSFDFTEHLGDITTPILVLAGSGDLQAPQSTVRGAFERIASEDKLYIEFGRTLGQPVDYGHGDLVFGREAPRVVFPHICDWIRRHSAPANASQKKN